MCCAALISDRSRCQISDVERDYDLIDVPHFGLFSENVCSARFGFLSRVLSFLFDLVYNFEVTALDFYSIFSYLKAYRQ